MRLISLTAENFKRLVAIRIKPSGALTSIVGRNGAGKTSVLDALSAALGGADEIPDMPVRRGETHAKVVVDLADLKVTRRWSPKGSTLEVTSPDGAKYPAPQKILDSNLGGLCFDPLEFSRMKPAEQVQTLGRAAGVDLNQMAAARKVVFDERTIVSRQAKAARAQLDGMPQVPDGTPAEPVKNGEIVKELLAAKDQNQKITEAEREIATAVAEVERMDRWVQSSADQVPTAEERGQELIRLAEEALARAREQATELVRSANHEHSRAVEAAAEAGKALADLRERSSALQPIDLAPIQQRIDSAEVTNNNVRLLQQRTAKAKEVQALEAKVRKLGEQIDDADRNRDAAIAKANLPVAGLSLSESGILLNGIPLNQASGAEQLRVSVALGLALNPKLKLMLIRDGSLLDAEGMRLLAELAEAADAQVLIERVAVGNDVGIVIEDGEIVSPVEEPEAEAVGA